MNKIKPNLGDHDSRIKKISRKKIHADWNQHFNFKRSLLAADDDVEFNILHLSMGQNKKNSANEHFKEDIESLFESIYPKEIPML